MEDFEKREEKIWKDYEDHKSLDILTEDLNILRKYILKKSKETKIDTDLLRLFLMTQNCRLMDEVQKRVEP